MIKRILGLSLTTILTTALFFSCGKSGGQNEKAASQEVAANIQKVTLDVQGMTCSGCEYNVESALKQIHGVAKVKADFSSHSAVVEFYPETATVDKMVEAVNKVGYQAKESKLN
ncbi:MAG: cation transporter [bacterium]